MKTLLILRHAKTERDNPDGDKKRALTNSGKRDALKTAQQIRSIFGQPDAIVTSDAKRARQTAEIVTEEIGYDIPTIIEPEVYGAEVDDLFGVIRRFADTSSCVVLVGHNPGLEELCIAVARDGQGTSRKMDPNFHLPTSGLFHSEFDIERWSEVALGKGRAIALYTPDKA